MGDEPLLGPRDVAHMLGLPLSWVYAAAERGELPSFKLGQYRRFRATEVDAWLERQRTQESARA